LELCTTGSASVFEPRFLMAAAILVPLIEGLGPPLINFLTGLIHKKALEAEQTHGPKSGPLKFADVFVGVMNDVAKAKAAGTISVMPDDNLVKIIIQAVTTSMMISGTLNGDNNPAPAVTVDSTSKQFVLKPGESVTIKC